MKKYAISPESVRMEGGYLVQKVDSFLDIPGQRPESGPAFSQITTRHTAKAAQQTFSKQWAVIREELGPLNSQRLGYLLQTLTNGEAPMLADYLTYGKSTPERRRAAMSLAERWADRLERTTHDETGEEPCKH